MFTYGQSLFHGTLIPSKPRFLGGLEYLDSDLIYNQTFLPGVLSLWPKFPKYTWKYWKWFYPRAQGMESTLRYHHLTHQSRFLSFYFTISGQSLASTSSQYELDPIHSTLWGLICKTNQASLIHIVLSKEEHCITEVGGRWDGFISLFVLISVPLATSSLVLHVGKVG